MKVIVVGGGGREHALAWKIAASPLVDEVIAAPGNAGVAQTARCVPLSAEDVEGQVELALQERADLVVVGPEVPLVAGLADRLQEQGVRVFGPSAAASRLEGSKGFSKRFMARHKIPTAAFAVHDDLDSALADVGRRDGPCVVKADGLAAGKGVLVCQTRDQARRAVQEILGEQRFGEAGNQVVIEDLLVGEEASVLALCDGKQVLPLVAAQDHKAAFDGDSGPNTGGMGAYAPAPVVTGEMYRRVIDEVFQPTVAGLAAEGTPFKGVLYAGLMIVEGVPLVLEYNVRFGDPECQPLLVLMDQDLVPLLVAAADGELGAKQITWHRGAAVCVVLASGGYPGAYEKGLAIKGLEKAGAKSGVSVFHAGTKLVDGQLVTSGGRVLGVTARGPDLREAIQTCYQAADEIQWDGMRMRRDIGHRAL